ncbi:YibE/F family protein [Natroniella sulfidigena]|uniref:YibE/F family protein n=1 Tax=Natroniella sulfidigena TaxID=723921 RepID=UPI002009FC10|nr:YibE/F family protein [Natroniella sulfidigena]MCK8817827.1 YibE/F family protein [Natroniella sulfidigena]
MKKIIIFCSVLLFIMMPSSILAQEQVSSQTVRGRIIEIVQGPTEEEQSYVADVQQIKVEITQGEFRGEKVTTNHTLSGNPARDFYYNEGDRVLLWVESQDGAITRSLVREVIRDHYLGYLALFFVFSLILVGGRQGLKTVLTLSITGFLVLKVLLPLILEGYPPILTTIIITSIIVSISLFITSGFTRKTLAAIIGTMGGVVVAGVLAWWMSSATRLTGLSGEESQMLMYIPQGTDFDFRGLLFAGMIIGAMGAVLDIGMSIASTIDEVKRANPSISTKDLIKSGLNVGRDIMGTMSNTLILAYTGASMSLLLVIIANEIPLSRITNMDSIATEIVRVLAGSIGLIYAIPITAITAGLLYRQVDFSTTNNTDQTNNL